MPCDREQLYLMPPSMQEWLPAGHLAWFVVDLVRQLELSAFYERYRADGWGRAAYEPGMMVTLLVYGYCLGERSSRQLERLCETDIAFRVVTANQRPDHSTIARFRQEHGAALAELFVGVLGLCVEAGLVKVGVVALDGTKMRANAALSANRTPEGLRAEVARILAEAQERDAAEDARYGAGQRGDELPAELQDPRSRLARPRECQERLQREADAQAAAQAGRIAQKAAQAQATGRTPRGRPLKAADATPPQDAKANVTDPGSRIMGGHSVLRRRPGTCRASMGRRW